MFSDGWRGYFCKVKGTITMLMLNQQFAFVPWQWFLLGWIFSKCACKKYRTEWGSWLSLGLATWGAFPRHTQISIHLPQQCYSGGVCKVLSALRLLQSFKQTKRSFLAGALVSCFSENRAFDNIQKKSNCATALLHLHNWDWWERKESVYSAGR